MIDEDGRPAEAQKLFTRRLALSLASEDGARTLAQLQVMGLTAGGRMTAAGTPSSARLGVWGATRTAGGEVELVRDPGAVEAWRFWADVERVAPKRGKRVVLIGESVARGYLYDPALTPARLIAQGLGGVEVVDLAASDLTAPELESVIASLAPLEPDAIVLFAGNNWHNVRFGLDELQVLAESLRAGGFPALRAAMVEGVILPRARATMDLLARVAGGRPVVVVVPEFDLADWRSEPSLLAPVLPQGANVRWMETLAVARRAEAAGDDERVAALARDLAGLDGGTSSIGFELLGRVAGRRGALDEARAAFEAARDAGYGTLVGHSPRCARPVQDVLRAKAAEHGFAVVDLPRVFAASLGGELPDRRLFLDYCHLTDRGMAIASSAIADALAPGLGVSARPAEPTLPPGDAATAHFLAAIHNAHYGQPAEILGHHLRRAVELSSGALDQIAWYLDVHGRGAEMWMCEPFDRLCASPLVRRYLAATDPRVVGRLADVELRGEMAAVLAESGRPIGRHVEARSTLDLLAPRHQARTFRERSGHSLGPTRAYHQALDLVSRFTFDRRQGGRMHLRLACRLPTSGADGAVRIRMNGTDGTSVDAGREWRAFDLECETRAGGNEITIEWPLREPLWREWIEADARRLERAVFPDALPAYGEIFELRLVATDASHPSSPTPRM